MAQRENYRTVNIKQEDWDELDSLRQVISENTKIEVASIPVVIKYLAAYYRRTEKVESTGDLK